MISGLVISLCIAGATPAEPLPEQEKPPIWNGFTIGEGDYVFRPKAILQTDARYFIADTDHTRIDTFLMRRVRPIFEGTLWKRVAFRIMPDFGQGKTVLEDAFAEVKFIDALRVRVGKFKVPFSLEQLQSDPDLALLERSLATSLAPARDVGVQLSGDVFNAALSYQVGFFDGSADGGSVDFDVDDQKDWFWRAFVKPFRFAGWKALEGVGVGFAYNVGTRRATASNPVMPTYRTPAQQPMLTFDSNGNNTGTSVAYGRINRYTPQAGIYIGPVGVLAEYVKVTEGMKKLFDWKKVTSEGFAVTASVIVTGQKNTYEKGLQFSEPFDLERGSIGAIEIAARYDQALYDVDILQGLANPTNNFRGSHGLWGGVNWYPASFMKIGVNYVNAKLLKPEGSPNKLKPREQSVLGRVQLCF